MMNKNVGLTLIVYGLAIGGLGWAIYQMAPALAQPTLIAGLVGGVLSIIWGIQWIRGRGRKVWPLLTLIPVCYVVLGQVVMAWMGETEIAVAALLTLGFLLSLGMVMRIAYYGVFGSAPPGRTENINPRVTTQSPKSQAGSRHTSRV